MKITVLSASVWEVRALIKALGLIPRGGPTYEAGTGKHAVTLTLTGMGIKQARASALKTAESSPDLVIAAGFAGSLRTDIRAGDLVINRARSSSNWADAAEELADTIKIRHHQGSFYCSEKIISLASEKKEIGLKSGAIAVEMESQPIFEVLSAKKIPVLFIRSVSDGMDQNLPDIGGILGPGGELRLGAVLKLIFNPVQWPGFIHLSLGSMKAGKNLAAIIKELIHHA